MSQKLMSWLLMTIVCSAGIGACAISPDDDSDVSIAGTPAPSPLGVKVVPINPQPKCTDAAGPNQSFNCLAAAWINVGTVEAMQTAATNCGCTAEIVTTNVVPAACNVKRVATFCPGTPPFNAVSPIPPGDYNCPGVDNDGDGQNDVVHVDYNNEPPFIGVHIDPANGGRLCDISLGANGMVDRVTIENCASCHGKNNDPNWEPTATMPEVNEAP